MSSSTTTLARDVYLELVRAHERAAAEAAALLREHGLSQPQYNVLRILRGASGQRGSCQYVGERLLTREPDVTRLLDRLQKAGLVTRRRSDSDRRVVEARLEPAGRALCDALDEPIASLHEEQFGHLGSAALAELLDLLQRSPRSRDEARAGEASASRS